MSSLSRYKFCHRCKTSKIACSARYESRWGPNAARADGLQAYCHECMSELTKEGRGPEAWRKEAALKEARIQKVKQRAARKAVGICIVCGQPSAPFVSCLKHRKRERERTKRRVRQRWTRLAGDSTRISRLDKFLMRKHVESQSRSSHSCVTAGIATHFPPT